MSTGGHRGQSLIEFALVAPILILLAMAVWDGGGVLRDQVVVQQAARDAARVAATVYAPSTSTPCSSPTTGSVADAVLASAGADLPGLSSAPGVLKPSALNICYPNAPAQSVVVQVTSVHALFTPVLRWMWGGSQGAVSLQASATFYLPPQPATAVPAPATPTPTPMPTPTPTPTPTPSPTLTPVPTPTRTPTLTPVPTATATTMPVATSTPATGTQPCTSFPNFIVPPLTTSPGFFTTINVPAPSYLTLTWTGPSPPGVFEVHLYEGLPFGGGSGFSSAAPPTFREVGVPTTAFQFGGMWIYFTASSTVVAPDMYTAYFYKRSGALTVESQGDLGCLPQ